MNYHRLSGNAKLKYMHQGHEDEYIVYRCRFCRVGVLKRDQVGHLLRCQGILPEQPWRLFAKNAPYLSAKQKATPKVTARAMRATTPNASARAINAATPTSSTRAKFTAVFISQHMCL